MLDIDVSLTSRLREEDFTKIADTELCRAIKFQAEIVREETVETTEILLVGL